MGESYVNAMFVFTKKQSDPRLNNIKILSENIIILTRQDTSECYAHVLNPMNRVIFKQHLRPNYQSFIFDLRNKL